MANLIYIFLRYNHNINRNTYWMCCRHVYLIHFPWSHSSNFQLSRGIRLLRIAIEIWHTEIYLPAALECLSLFSSLDGIWKIIPLIFHNIWTFLEVESWTKNVFFYWENLNFKNPLNLTIFSKFKKKTVKLNKFQSQDTFLISRLLII